MLVLLDTSFLLTMLRDHKEIDDEIMDTLPGPVQIATVDLVQFELANLARRNSSQTGGLANLAVGLLEGKSLPVLDSKFVAKDVDTAILAVALSQKNPVVVATVDRRLRETLAKNGISSIYPKLRKGLILSTARHSSP